MSFVEKAKSFSNKAGDLLKKGASTVKEKISAPCTVNIVFNDKDERQQFTLPDGSGKYYIFEGNDLVAGTISVKLHPGKKIEHVGMKVVLVGQTENKFDKSVEEFLSLTKELSPAGELVSDQMFEFDFGNVEKSHESYHGVNIKLRYMVRFVMGRMYSQNVVEEEELWVQLVQPEPAINHPIRMEVGIEDCLHIEFLYHKSKYSLNEVITGVITFVLVRIKVQVMEISIIRKETTGTGVNAFTQSDTLAKYEIMDGVPVKAEVVPLRFYLSGVDVTPTYVLVNNRFSVKYVLNLVLLDEHDRRYFKQQEITFWRDAIGPHDPSWFQLTPSK